MVDTILNGTTGTAQTVSDLSAGPPFTYDIERLVTGQRYYVRVSARNQWSAATRVVVRRRREFEVERRDELWG